MSRWNMVRLGDVLSSQSKSKIKAGDALLEGRYRFFTSSKVQSKFSDDFQYDKPALIFGTGGNASVHYCEQPFSTSTDCIVFYSKRNCISLKTIYMYILRNIQLLEEGFKGAGLQHISKDYILNIEIPLPPPDEQKKIAGELDKISNLITKRKRQIEKMDLLIKAKFVEMFGETVQNSHNLDIAQLGEIAEVVSGITKGRKVKSFELTKVPYMAVSNVKDGYIDWTTVKTIEVTKTEIEQYRLQPNDVLMTEGGDPDKLGRGAIVKIVPENCIHQNHIFRVRFNEKNVSPQYFSEYLKHPNPKIYFLRCAKQTTGIASINMNQLRSLPVLLPPIHLQKQFSDFLIKVEQIKTTMQQGLQKLETLYKARLQEYFE